MAFVAEEEAATQHAQWWDPDQDKKWGASPGTPSERLYGVDGTPSYAVGSAGTPSERLYGVIAGTPSDPAHRRRCRCGCLRVYGGSLLCNLGRGTRAIGNSGLRPSCPGC